MVLFILALSRNEEYNNIRSGRCAASVVNTSRLQARSLKYKIKERKFRICMRKIVKHQLFYWIVIILVFMNALCCCIEHHNQPDWLSDFLCK